MAVASAGPYANLHFALFLKYGLCDIVHFPAHMFGTPNGVSSLGFHGDLAVDDSFDHFSVIQACDRWTSGHCM